MDAHDSVDEGAVAGRSAGQNRTGSHGRRLPCLSPRCSCYGGALEISVMCGGGKGVQRDYGSQAREEQENRSEPGPDLYF